MKTLTLLIVAVMLSISVMAQEKTLLNGEMHNGGYGAFFTKAGGINGKTGVFMGGQGAWVLGHKLALGGKGYVLISPNDAAGLNNIKMEFGCWGGLVEYVIASDKLFHLNVNTMIGAGGVRYTVKDYRYNHSEVDYTEDAVFVIEPGLDAELNIHKNFRIGLGVYYRMVSNVDYADLTNADLSGLSGQITFKFGAF
jgi:hypothetical protein